VKTILKKEMSAKTFNEKLIKSGKTTKRIKEIKPNLRCDKCKQSYDLTIFEDNTKLKICDCDKRLYISPNQMKKIAYFKSISSIPLVLKKATFDNFYYENDKQLKNMYQGAKYYILNSNKENQKTLVLRGTIGSGKTHIAIACMKEFQKKNLTTYFISFTDLIQRLKESFEDSKRQSQIMQDVFNCDVLILDDIGVGKLTEYELKQLFNIVDKRQGKFNIYTTNMSDDELTSSKEWKRITSRLFNRKFSDILKVTTADYRMKKTRI